VNELSTDSLVEILRVDRTYADLWAAAVASAQRSMYYELEYWLVMYKIKRDGKWVDEGFDSQKDWIQFITTIDRFEGGCAYSTFFKKMSLIEDLAARGVSDEGIVRALSIPTASEMLMGATEEQLAGRTVEDVIDEIHELNPGKAAMNVAEIINAPKMWCSEALYNSRARLFTFSISQDTENEIDIRAYIIPEVEPQDAEFFARGLRRKLEWT